MLPLLRSKNPVAFVEGNSKCPPAFLKILKNLDVILKEGWGDTWWFYRQRGRDSCYKAREASLPATVVHYVIEFDGKEVGHVGDVRVWGRE